MSAGTGDAGKLRREIEVLLPQLAQLSAATGTAYETWRGYDARLTAIIERISSLRRQLRHIEQLQLEAAEQEQS